jgi:hypothetical protein
LFPIFKVYLWPTSPSMSEPMRLIRDSNGLYEIWARDSSDTENLVNTLRLSINADPSLFTKTVLRLCSELVSTKYTSDSLRNLLLASYRS